MKRLIILLLFLLSCDSRNMFVSKEIDLDRIEYVKDKHGICYAYIIYRSYGTTYEITFTEIDCKKVGLK